MPSARHVDEAPTTAGMLMWVADAAGRTFESVAARFELSPAQARALLLLQEGLPMNSIADQLRCDASNITGIADRLTSRGLATRQPAPGDRRVKRLILTDQGAELRTKLEQALFEASPVTAALDPAEQATLRGLLEKIVAKLSADHCHGRR